MHGAPMVASLDAGNDLQLKLAMIIGVACLIWYSAVVLVCGIGYIQLQRYYSSIPKPSISASLPISRVPHVTILRPVKGVEPNLYECLGATFRQQYPREKLTVYFCVASRHDPAAPILERLLEDFPGFDAKVLVEEEDPNLQKGGNGSRGLGPNPKIRNMSHGYREAKGDLIWVIDCNIWVGKGVAGRMVDKLCGFAPAGVRNMPYKFVHQLPLVVETAGGNQSEEARGALGYSNGHANGVQMGSKTIDSKTSSILRRGGGRLEELFLSSSHAKFYTAINTILLAPCIVGKSNMYRRSHLNYLTSSNPARSPGIDFFSDFICEDHLIGDLLWKQKVPEEESGEVWGKHALVFSDLAIQPMAGMSVSEYIARRMRWLRVRKFTVTLATLVEPGTESFLCSLYGAFAVTSVPWFEKTLSVPPTWSSFFLFFLASVSIWAFVDWTVYLLLHSASSIEVDEHTPSFAQPLKTRSRRPFREWLLAWLGREALALPIWVWAVFCGTTVVWRGKKLWVGMDMRVHEVPAGENVKTRID